MYPRFQASLTSVLVVFLMLTVLPSCEDFFFLPSKKKIKDDIEHKWQRDFLGLPVTYNEFWIFESSAVYITREETATADTLDNGLPDKNTGDNVDTLDIGGFSIDTEIFKAFVKINGFTTDSALIEYNTKWEIVELDISTLYIVGDRPSGKGLMQREFKRIE